MKLSKKGQSGISGKVYSLIIAVIGVIVLVTMAPTLFTMLETALNDSALSSVPFLGTASGLLTTIFGAVIFLGALGYLLVQMKSKR